MTWKKRESKYKNHRVVVDGISFQSKKEANRWLELKLMAAAGEILDLRRQVRFELIPTQRYKDRRTGRWKTERGVWYIADFAYVDARTDEFVVEDVKSESTITPVYKIKRKLMRWIHGITIKET